MARHSPKGLTPAGVNVDAAIRIAASAFICAPFRERFVHEALKRPDRLLRRVCHHIEDVFLDRFRGGYCRYNPTALCLTFYGAAPEVTTWADAMETVGRGGRGNLIIDASGASFFADAEGEPPPVVYGGVAELTRLCKR